MPERCDRRRSVRRAGAPARWKQKGAAGQLPCALNLVADGEDAFNPEPVGVVDRIEWRGAGAVRKQELARVQIQVGPEETAHETVLITPSRRRPGAR